MGRIGKQIINIPDGVTVSIQGRSVVVSGPKGSLNLQLHSEVAAKLEDKVMSLSTLSETRLARQVHGTFRTLVFNMVKGVTDGWAKTLEINGTGYRAAVTGKDLTLNLGFSHPVIVNPPAGIVFEVKENKITVSGPDKILVGEVAAKIRAIKPPDPYKAKGVKYLDEQIRRKAGKAAKAAGGTGGK